MENELQFETPFDAFVFDIRSPVTRGKYLGRLGYFLSYVGITEGNLENRCNILGQRSKADSTWLANNAIKYLHIHRQRVERREISAATLSNYIKPIKLFCEQLEISLPWKRITLVLHFLSIEYDPASNFNLVLNSSSFSIPVNSLSTLINAF